MMGKHGKILDPALSRINRWSTFKESRSNVLRPKPSIKPNAGRLVWTNDTKLPVSAEASGSIL
jgi:hypothetical protein